MSMVWIAVLVLSGPAGEVGTASAASSPQGLPANEVQQPLVPLAHGAGAGGSGPQGLARWAHADEKDAEAAAREFLVLYKELRGHPPAGGRSSGASRKGSRPAGAALADDCPRGGTPAGLGRATARHRGNRRPSGGGVGAAAPAGGAGMAMPGGGGPNGPDADEGQNLVDLIQTTIAPETWDVNGGQGSIYYWRNQHVLVIRATDDVHGFVGDVIDQLQRAGN